MVKISQLRRDEKTYKTDKTKIRYAVEEGGIDKWHMAATAHFVAGRYPHFTDSTKKTLVNRPT